MHGAIGFTAEHSLHHATQRLWSWRLGESVCRQGADQLWPSLVDGAMAVP